MAEAVVREALKKALAALERTQQDLARLREERHEPIAIVGIGCRFPGGASDPERLWELLQRGAVTAGPVPASRWDARAFYSPDPAARGKTHAARANFLDEAIDTFDAPFFNLSAKECEALDPQQRLLLEVSWEALEDAACDASALSGSRTGVYVGISCDDYAQAHRYSGDLTRVDGYSLTGTLLSTAAGRLSYTFGFEGPCVALDTACSSSLVAVHLAMRALRSGEADLALAGGANLTLTPPNFVCSTKIGSISADGRCKTFDASADGYGRGEGCGVLVLQRLSDARRTGRRIHAVLRGSAINQDGRSNGLTAPNGKAQEKVLRAALEDARLEPARVSYIEAHGTGTPLGDPIELEAIGRVMSGAREGVGPVLIGTLKSNIGHTESASGVAGVIKVALALDREELPAHVGMTTPSEEIRWAELPVEVVTRSRAWPRGDVPRRAGVSSFGFSGTNAHVIVEEAPRRAPVTPRAGGGPELLVLSARSDGALGELAGRYARHLRARPEALADICHTAAAGRAHFGCRLAVLGESAEQLAEHLETFVTADPTGRGRAGVYGSAEQARPRVAFLFTGQGSQVVGMGRRYFDAGGAFRQAFEACDALMSPAIGQSLTRLVYGADADARTLQNTLYAQPCLFALGYALTEQYRAWGIEPEFVAGHSVGEYAAACAAGVLALPDATRLVCERARLLASLPAGGGMAAVSADAGDVRRWLAELGSTLCIAAINAPGNTVVSGPRSDISKLTSELEKRGITARALDVSHAFHSSLMSPALGEFRDIAARVSYGASRLRCFSTVHGALGSDSEYRSADYWTQNIDRPVDFLAATTALASAGANVFVEIGATPTLIGFARRTLGGKGLFVQSLDARRPDADAPERALSQLYARGLSIDWHAVWSGRSRSWIDNPHYPFQRRRYWKEPVVDLRTGASDAELVHPLLGRCLDSPALGEARVYEALYRADSPRFLRDHVIFDRIISPAAAHLCLGLLAGTRLEAGAAITLEDVEFLAPLVIPEDAGRRVQVITRGSPEGAQTFSVSSRGAEEPDPWQLHCTGSLRCDAVSPPVSSNAAPWAEIERRCAEPVEPGSVYDRLQTSGYSVGPSFRALRAVRRGDGEALCWLRLPAEARGEAAEGLHPGMIDALFQGAMAAAEPAVQELLSERHVLIPLQVSRLHQRRSLPEELVCHVRARAESELVRCSFSVWTASAELVLEIDDFVLKRTTEDTLYRALRATAPRPAAPGSVAELPAAAATRGVTPAFVTEWQAIQPGAVRAARDAALATDQHYLVLSDHGALGDALCEHLRERGVACTRVVRAASSSPASEETRAGRVLQIDPERLDQWQSVLSQVAPGAAGTVHVIDLWAFDTPAALDPSSAELARASEALCAHSLQAARALLGWQGRATLVLASAHVWPVTTEDRTASFASAVLWGLGRTLRLEHPDLPLTLLDLEPETRRATLDALIAAATCPAGERDLALRRGGRLFAPRLRRETQSDVPGASAAAVGAASHALEPVPSSRALQLPSSRVLDDLRLEPRPRRTPEPGEVEVEIDCAGLNFRDVLNALGQYPGPAGALGFECTGRVARTGEGVTSLSPGDPVIVLAAPGCMADFITVDTSLVTRSPLGMRPEDVVSVPATFLTALYALEELGRMRAGQRVLIHAAAGGVGLAAVQLASRAGLEVFATAGSPEKRALLTALGVPHVYDSRSLGFADAILADTEGRGVDLVLNSLSGEFIDRSVAVLSEEGCFLELGKRGIWDERRLRAQRPRASFHAFDLMEVARAEPRRILALLDEVFARMERGELRPLPVTAFALEEAPAAFRHMAQGKHVGKIVLSRRTPSLGRAPLARGDRSYLITGGTGGLGLAVGHWLARAGAGQIILMGRSAPSDAAEQAAAAMRAQGAQVRFERGDVALEAEVEAIVARRRAPGELPLGGVVHAAGVLDDSVATEQTRERFARVLAPKLSGAWSLHAATRSLDLDFFVLFSSIAGVVGAAGQLNYAAANAALDALSHYRRARGWVATSIAWGPWGGAGMAASMDPERLAQRGLRPLTAEAALKALERTLRGSAAPACIADVDWARYARVAAPPGPGLLSELSEAGADGSDTRESAAPASGLLERLEAALPAQRSELLVEQLQLLARSVLGYGEGDLVRRDQPLVEQGFDSLMAVEMRNRVSQSVGRRLPASVLFDHPTLERLAHHLLAEVIPLASAKAAPPPPRPLRSAPEAASDVVDRLSRLLNG